MGVILISSKWLALKAQNSRMIGPITFNGATSIP